MTKVRGSANDRAGDRRHADLSYLRIVEHLTASGITQVELSKAVGAGVRTVQAWASGDNKPSGVKAQRLLDVETIVRLLKDVYTDEGIRIWLHSRNRNLALERPIDLLTAGRIDEVIEEAQAVSGGFAS